jgi:hypothetical protein
MQRHISEEFSLCLGLYEHQPRCNLLWDNVGAPREVSEESILTRLKSSACAATSLSHGRVVQASRDLLLTKVNVVQTATYCRDKRAAQSVALAINSCTRRTHTAATTIKGFRASTTRLSSLLPGEDGSMVVPIGANAALSRCRS